MAAEPERVSTLVDGRTLSLSNLDKVLYPASGFTKAQVIDYYARVAPTLLAHLADRPLTRVRFPDGVQAGSFFEKNPPAGMPQWVRTLHVVTSDGPIDFPVADSPAVLVYLANLAALELHVPLWTGDRQAGNTQLVVDLDPGAQLPVTDLVKVALLVANRLADDGLTPYPRSSGRKGLQLYCPLAPTPGDAARDYVAAVADDLARQHPHLIVTTPVVAARVGKVFVDYNQNQPGRTMIAPYSLRGAPTPTVATPLTWPEVAAATTPGDLHLSTEQVLARIARIGDLAAPLLDPVDTPLPATR